MARECRLEDRRDVTRINDNAYVITGQPHAWFLTTHNHRVPVSQILRYHGITNHNSRVHGWIVCENQGFTSIVVRDMGSLFKKIGKPLKGNAQDLF